MKNALNKAGACGLLVVAAVLIPFGALAEGVIKASSKAYADYVAVFKLAKEIFHK